MSEQENAVQLMNSVASSIEMDIEAMQLQCTWALLAEDLRASKLVKSAKIEILFVEETKEVQVINQRGVLAIHFMHSELKVDKDVRFNVISLAATIAGSMIGSVLPSQALVNFDYLKGAENGSATV